MIFFSNPLLQPLGVEFLEFSNVGFGFRNLRFRAEGLEGSDYSAQGLRLKPCKALCHVQTEHVSHLFWGNSSFVVPGLSLKTLISLRLENLSKRDGFVSAPAQNTT